MRLRVGLMILALLFALGAVACSNSGQESGPEEPAALQEESSAPLAEAPAPETVAPEVTEDELDARYLDFVERFIGSLATADPEQMEVEPEDLDRESLTHFALQMLYDESERTGAEMITDEQGFCLFGEERVQGMVAALFGIDDFDGTDLSLYSEEAGLYRYYPAHGFAVLNFSIDNPPSRVGEMRLYDVRFFEIEDLEQASEIRHIQYRFLPTGDGHTLRFELWERQEG